MTATIKIFPNKLDREEFELCKTTAGKTFEQWLIDSVPGYYQSETPLFSALVNRVFLAPEDWPHYVIQPSDQIELTVEAKAVAVVVIAIIALAYAIYTINNIPDNYNNTTPDGSSIYDANAQGNKPRLMGIIPEIAGRHKVFPDLLTIPRREYINNEQWLYLMLSVGVGNYEINSEEIFIGNTPVSNYAGDVNYSIFSPGDAVTTHEAYRNIYTSIEVGGTAGTSGIELKGSQGIAGSLQGGGWRWDFSGNTITAFKYLEIDDGQYTLLQTKFRFPAEDIVTITGTAADDGDYRVVSVDGSVAVMQKVDALLADDVAWTSFVGEIKATAEISLLSVGGDGLYNGPFYACPANETTDTIWLDFIMQQGLGELDDDGTFLSKTVDIAIQYRDENDGSWTTVNHSFSGATNDQLAQTFKIILPSKIRPLVQVKRITAAIDNTRIYDKVEWSGLKSELTSATSYADVTTIAVKIRGTNALSSSAENKFNLIATRKLPIYTAGAWTAEQATDDIAPFFSYIVKDVGHTDLQMGLEELDLLHTKWSTRGDTFSAVFDTDSTLFEALKRVLAVGYAEPTLDYGQIIPVRDEVRTSFEHMYQPDNMVSELERNIKLIDADEADGVEVEYFSPTTWKPETVMCLLPGDSGIKPEKVRAFGITDKTKAWRLGMRKRRGSRYQRTQYSFKTEMDALNSKYLSYCALADDIPGYSQTGRVVAISGRLITVDQALGFGEGTHHLAIRKPDGTLSGVYIATAGNDEFTVNIDSDLDFIPVLNGSQEPPLFMFGTATRFCLPALVKEIKPNGSDNVSVTAVNYDVRVYADDDNAPG